MAPDSFRLLKGLGIAAVASLALVACGGGGTTSSNLASDQTLKFPILGDFGTLDPAVADAETDSEIQQNMFNGLVKFDNNLNVVPDIAASMPTVSSDGLTYTFKLRSDVTFSNGDKVTSADVLYSWNRGAAYQGSYATNLGAIDGYDKVSANTVNGGAALEALLEKNDPSVTLSGLSAPDAHTVVVKLSAPAGWFLSAIALAGTTGQLVDKNVVKQDPDNWWTKPATAIGTGAYKMTGYVPKQSVDFQAVDNWWGSPKPTLKKVHIDILGNAHSAITAYEQGSYDIYGYGGYSSAPVDDILRIQGIANEKNQLIIHAKVRTTWVQFNLVHDAKRSAKGPFLCGTPTAAGDDTCTQQANPKGWALRMAFALAVDKAKLATVVCHDIVCAPATGGLITKGLIGYAGDNTDPLAKFDAAQAKTYLDQGGGASAVQGLSYTYDPNNPLNTSVAQFLQDQWQTNLGVHVDLTPVDHSAFIKGYLSGKFVMARNGWQADYNHPQDWVDNLWGKGPGCPDSGCGSGFDTKAYDDAVAAADALPVSQATAKYQAIMKTLSDDAIYIPLYYSQGAFLIKPYVKGAGTNNFFDYYWDQIQILQH
ncbi:MAG TPA: peptide ABC transporter substrate-binding protein [Candidatus Dormibacteraeota bacterium]|nr:peptide ABC transporter substrate-binding protein [Candidatus Dormibacteraeota bacterium]